MGGTGPEVVAERIYRVGGPDSSDYRDSAVYLLDFGDPVLIDSGSGFGLHNIVSNIQLLGFRPDQIGNIILTHCHFDHIGGAPSFRNHSGTKLIMHELDARVVESGDDRLTAAFCFGVRLEPMPIDEKLYGEGGVLQFGTQDIRWLHTPGHSAGSISVYVDRGGVRTLFVQDIAAPLLEEFECDPGAWGISVEKLIALDADILCDGHSGVYRSKRLVKKYLEQCSKAAPNR